MIVQQLFLNHEGNSSAEIIVKIRIRHCLSLRRQTQPIAYFIVEDGIGISGHILGKRLPRVSSSNFQAAINACNGVIKRDLFLEVGAPSVVSQL